MLDDSVVLIPTESYVSYEAKDSDRMNIYFQLADGYEIGDNPLEVSVHNIIYSSIDQLVIAADTSVLDTLENDPMGIYDGSIRQSGNLLDVFFYIDYSGYKYHTIDLVYFPDSTATDPNGVYLEFRHNSNYDSSNQTLQFLSCFDMTSIAPFQNVQDSVPYTIIVNPGAFQGVSSRFEGYFYNPELLK